MKNISAQVEPWHSWRFTNDNKVKYFPKGWRERAIFMTDCPFYISQEKPSWTAHSSELVDVTRNITFLRQRAVDKFSAHLGDRHTHMTDNIWLSCIFKDLQEKQLEHISKSGLVPFFFQTEAWSTDNSDIKDVEHHGECTRLFLLLHIHAYSYIHAADDIEC